VQQGAVQSLVEQPNEQHPPVRLGEQVGPDAVVDGGVLDRFAEWPLGGGEVVEGVNAASVKVERQHITLFRRGRAAAISSTVRRVGTADHTRSGSRVIGSSDKSTASVAIGGSTGKLAPSIRTSWLPL
jgi:hypothetical protein